MKETRLIMGMPIEIEILLAQAGVGDTAREALEDAFAYFTSVDGRFSTYKEDSEISHINRGALAPQDASVPMREVFALAEKTKSETEGYFDIRNPSGHIDPSGIVKGWAIREAARRVWAHGHSDFFINAGGDIASSGVNAMGESWSIGIKNPFNQDEIVKIVYPRGKGVATSGSYIRGAHIYNPHNLDEELRDIVSITVIGPDVLEADRFATAAFAMGAAGVAFIEARPGFEAYAIDANGIATMTSGFAAYTQP